MAEKKTEGKTYTERQVTLMVNAAAKKATEKNQAENEQNAEIITQQKAIIDELKAQLAELKASAANNIAPAPQVVQVAANTPMVTMWFQDEISPDNVLQFGRNGKFGTVTGASGLVTVTKADFKGEFHDNMVQAMLHDRTLIVLDGLTDEEKIVYGVDYKDGEVMDQRMFNTMLDMGEKLLEIYPKLCQSNKEMVARRFLSAYEDHDNRINRELVVELNNLSKQDLANAATADERKGLFWAVIRGMNEAEE